MIEKDKKDAPKPEPYNPEKAWWNRQTPSTLSGIRRRQQHQFSQDIGGCDANYKKGF